MRIGVWEHTCKGILQASDVQRFQLVDRLRDTLVYEENSGDLRVGAAVVEHT